MQTKLSSRDDPAFTAEIQRPASLIMSESNPYGSVSRMVSKYNVLEKVGQGTFGEVYLAKNVRLGTRCAIKVILKRQGNSESIRNELSVLLRLDHPSVLKLYEYYQDARRWYIVTEYFEGQQLFSYIVQRKRLSEAYACTIMRELLKALTYIHAQGIAHRDIKAENIMVSLQDPTCIKVIDWGLGCLDGVKMERKCGTPEYCAPEIFRGHYSFSCDVWSAGVLLYVMLSGRLPFRGANTQQTVRLVQKGEVIMEGPIWQVVSQEAKTLLHRMLSSNPVRRLSAAECLMHPWFNSSLPELPHPILTSVLDSLSRYCSERKFYLTLLSYIQGMESSWEITAALKKQFLGLDTNNDGKVDFSEFQRAFTAINGHCTSRQELFDLFVKLDSDGSGSISYSEYVRGVIGTKMKDCRAFLEKAFKAIDTNGDGSICRTELKFFLEKVVSQNIPMEAVLNRIDTNRDGLISFDEFQSFIAEQMERHCSVKSSLVNQLDEESTVEVADSKQETEYIPTANSQYHQESIQAQASALINQPNTDQQPVQMVTTQDNTEEPLIGSTNPNFTAPFHNQVTPTSVDSSFHSVQEEPDVAEIVHRSSIAGMSRVRNSINMRQLSAIRAQVLRQQLVPSTPLANRPSNSLSQQSTAASMMGEAIDDRSTAATNQSSGRGESLSMSVDVMRQFTSDHTYN